LKRDDAMVIFTMRQFLSLTDAQKCRFLILVLKNKAKIKEVEETKTKKKI
jgi:hypothetical protein